MPTIIIPQRFAQRIDTAVNWTAKNSMLYYGEIGFEADEDGMTLKWKVGDGVTPWNSLPYFSSGGGSIDMRVDGGFIQFSVDEGDTWENLIAIADLQGEDGKSAYEVAVENGFIGTSGEWLASLQGEPGEDSTVPGPPGPAIELDEDGTYIRYRTIGDPDWINLIAIADLTGGEGKSAYQSALDNGFVGTEVDWLLSLHSTVPGPAGGPTEVLSTSGALTLDAATHKGKMLLHTTGVITLPETAAAGFVQNDIVEVRRQGVGAVSFVTAGAASMDYNNSLYSPTIMNSKDVVGLKVIGVNTWALFGPLADL